MKSAMLMMCIVLALCLTAGARKPTKQDNEKNRPSKRQQGSTALTCPSGKVQCHCQAPGEGLAVEPSEEVDEPSLPGGLGKEVPVDKHVSRLVKKLSKQIEREACKLTDNCKTVRMATTPDPIKYRQQVVTGSNYFVQVSVSNTFFVVRIYEDLQAKVKYVGIKGPLKESDPIEYFD